MRIFVGGHRPVNSRCKCDYNLRKGMESQGDSGYPGKAACSGVLDVDLTWESSLLSNQQVHQGWSQQLETVEAKD